MICETLYILIYSILSVTNELSYIIISQILEKQDPECVVVSTDLLMYFELN